MIKLLNFTQLTHDAKVMVLEWRNHPNINKWMFNQEPISLTKHLDYIDSLDLRKDRCYFLLKNDDKAIGVIDFTDIDYKNKSANIGLYSKPELKGVGSLLMETIISYAFNILKLDTLISEVFEENIPAINLYKKFEFKEINKRENIIIMELKNENR